MILRNTLISLRKLPLMKICFTQLQFNYFAKETIILVADQSRRKQNKETTISSNHSTFLFDGMAINSCKWKYLSSRQTHLLHFCATRHSKRVQCLFDKGPVEHREWFLRYGIC
jgi:hypothetical protein